MSALQHGWNGERDVPGSFWVRFAPCTRQPLSWKEELYSAAREVAKAAGGKPLWLCSSGGIDSEIMCRAFFEQGIHFSVLTVEHAAGTNRNDIAYAQAWCKRSGVHQQLLRLDMGDFLGPMIDAYADEGYESANVFRYFQLKLLEEVESMGGYAVLGGGEQLYRVAREGDSIGEAYLEFESGVAVPLEWCARNATSHEPYFYYVLPEVASAFLEIPIVRFATRHPDIFRHHVNTFLFKRLIYQAEWPDMVARQKLSGYEAIYDERVRVQKSLAARFGARVHTYQLPVARFAEQLRPPALK